MKGYKPSAKAIWLHGKRKRPTVAWKARVLKAEARIAELEQRIERLRQALGNAQGELGLHDYSTGHPDDRSHEMGQ